MKVVNTVILAGDKKGSILIENDNKAFLQVNNIPCIIHTLKAFLDSSYTGKIIVVGPAARLCKVIDEYNLPLESRIIVIEQHESMIENGKAGYIAALEGVPEGTSLESLYESEYTEIPAVVAPCDIPLITPHEIDEFIEKANMDEHDYYIGLCSEDVLEFYYPGAESPGIRMNYLHMREGNFRVNNLHILKPLKIVRLRWIEKMYELRYQTHLLNILRLLLDILLDGKGIIKALYYTLKLQLVRIYFNKGLKRLYQKTRNSTEIYRVLKSIGTMLGTRVSYISTSYGGATLDVDHADEKKIIEEMYDKWMKHQRSIMPTGK